MTEAKQQTESQAPLSVMLSYAQADKVFVKRLHDVLLAQRRSCWVDFNGPPEPPRCVDYEIRYFTRMIVLEQ